VSELLEGETLRERVGQGEAPVCRAIDAAVQIARRLAAAHARGVVHRDLKPENVVLRREGPVKIANWPAMGRDPQQR
jgi:serine/threonine-protein kinase